MLPRVGFDTSGINKFEDRGATSEALMGRLECGFEVVMTATSADEIVATLNPVRRGGLLSRFGRLLRCGVCIWPPGEIIRLLVSANLSNPSRFEWAKVKVRAREYEAVIGSRDFDDELCALQRADQFKTEKAFESLWKNLRPKLDAILAKDPSGRPVTYRDALAIATAEGGVLWGIGQALYGHVSGHVPSERDTKAFMGMCPPFRAACHGLVMAWFKRSLRVQDGTATGGRNDLLTATYLPYCDRFVTDDRPQKTELREIAAEARIDCEILSLEEFELSVGVLAKAGLAQTL